MRARIQQPVQAPWSVRIQHLRSRTRRRLFRRLLSCFDGKQGSYIVSILCNSFGNVIEMLQMIRQDAGVWH